VKLCVARFLSLTLFMPKKFAVIKYTPQNKTENKMNRKLKFDRKALFWTLIGFSLGATFMLLMIG